MKVSFFANLKKINHWKDILKKLWGILKRYPGIITIFTFIVAMLVFIATNPQFSTEIYDFVFNNTKAIEIQYKENASANFQLLTNERVYVEIDKHSYDNLIIRGLFSDSKHYSCSTDNGNINIVASSTKRISKIYSENFYYLPYNVQDNTNLYDHSNKPIFMAHKIKQVIIHDPKKRLLKGENEFLNIAIEHYGNNQEIVPVPEKNYFVYINGKRITSYTDNSPSFFDKYITQEPLNEYQYGKVEIKVEIHQGLESVIENKTYEYHKEYNFSSAVSNNLITSNSAILQDKKGLNSLTVDKQLLIPDPHKLQMKFLLSRDASLVVNFMGVAFIIGDSDRKTINTIENGYLAKKITAEIPRKVSLPKELPIDELIDLSIEYSLEKMNETELVGKYKFQIVVDNEIISYDADSKQIELIAKHPCFQDSLPQDLLLNIKTHRGKDTSKIEIYELKWY